MSEIVYSPLDGEVISITNVDDEMFAKKMLGDGVAFIPNEKKLYSPIDGVVSMVYETQHAIGIKTKEGKDLLIHIGIETVQLHGKPFKTKVKVGDKVKQGDLLTVVDWNYIKRNGCDPVVPIVIMDSPIVVLKDAGKVKSGDPIFKIY